MSNLDENLTRKPQKISHDCCYLYDQKKQKQTNYFASSTQYTYIRGGGEGRGGLKLVRLYMPCPQIS